MNPATAVGFILSGLSLRLCHAERADTRRAHLLRRARHAFALAVVCIGFAKLASLAGYDAGIDHVLFTDKVNLGSPNRMAPQTALNFLLLGTALLAVNSRIGGYYPSEWLGAASMFVALFAVIGYAYGLTRLYQVGPFISMALNTALAFGMLSVGILCASPDRGLMKTLTSDHLGGIMARRLLPAVIGVPLAIGVLRLGLQGTGLYHAEFGLSLGVLGTTIVFAASVWWSAASLNRVAALREEAERTNARLAAIIASSDDAIIGEALDGAVMSWNKGADRLFGYSEREMIGRYFSALLAPDCQDEETEILDWIRNGGRIDQYETVGVTKDGRPIELALTVSPIRDEAGTIIGASKIARDITERKQTDRRLAAQLAVTRVLAESASPDEAIPRIVQTVCECLDWDAGAAWLLDEQSAVLRCEVWHSPLLEIPRFKAATLKSSAERGTDLPGRVWASHRPLWIAGLAEEENFPRRAVALEESLRTGFAVPILVGDHVLGVIECFSRQVRDEDGRLLSVMAAVGGSIGQFMARKQAEEKMRDALKRKSELISIVSHELRTPMTAIKEGIDLVLDGSAGPVNAEQLDYLRTVERNVDRLVRLVNDVLDFQRFEAGRMPFRMKPENLNVLIQEMIEEFQPAAKRKGLELSAHLSPNLPPVWCDRDRISQVLGNLLSNAINFTSRGRVSVRSEPDGHRARVAIQDQGCGVKTEDLPKLFESFSHISHDGYRKPGGSGLGLAIAKQIIKGHSGELWATSAYGVGSTFYFTLPTHGAQS
jgi:PAS domain S-box-containing protein